VIKIITFKITNYQENYRKITQPNMIPVCTYFVQNRCKFGNNCRFSHHHVNDLKTSQSCLAHAEYCKELSDHIEQIAQIQVGNFKFHVMTYNILNLQSSRNTAYPIIETLEQYKWRLEQIAIKVNNLINTHNLSIIALQEAPVGNEMFKQELIRDGWEVVEVMMNQNQSLIVMFSRLVFDASIIMDSSCALIFSGQHRSLSLEMTINESGERFILTNIHAPFGSPNNVISIPALLYGFEKGRYQHIIMGDFNSPQPNLQTGITAGNLGTCLIQCNGKLADFMHPKYDGFMATDGVKIQIQTSRAFQVQPNGKAKTISISSHIE